jgi:moderate conductance mechanosensitive channel
MRKISPAIAIPYAEKLAGLLRDWGEDSRKFLRDDVPKILLILLVSLLLIRGLRLIIRQLVALQVRKLQPGVRVQQLRTLADVITSIGVFVILFVAALEILPLLGLNLGPLIASAGVAGLAIGFGAQTLVHDFLNGVLILVENQYDIGDRISVAGVKGTVEQMTLRHTALRDHDGTVHIVPNSQILIVSNMSRDWALVTMRVVVAYRENSDRIVPLLQQIGEEVRHDPKFAQQIVGEIQVPGIDRVGSGEAEYLMLVKTLPNQQYDVSRELRRRINEVFEKNQVQSAGPGRAYVTDPADTPAH